MTNYMGITRLKKILHNYLVNVKGVSKRIEKEIFYNSYHKGRGCEFFSCSCGEYTLKLIADGTKVKTVTINEYKYDESTEEDIYYDRIITYYDESFNPLPNATWFSSKVAGIKARKEGGRFFAKGKDNEAEANRYVCFDIAKKQQDNSLPNKLDYIQA